MNTLEDTLRTAMRAETADVLSSPARQAATIRGGRRRQLHLRLVALAVPLLVVASVAGATTLVRRGGHPPAPLDNAAAARLTSEDRDLLARPTDGDLAGDGSYLAAAVRAWRHNYNHSANADRGIFDHLLGQPKVVWAGRTPAGPAAIVVQVADLRKHSDIQLDREGPALLWGFVGPDGTVVADGYPVPGAPDIGGAFVDAGHRVLVLFNRGAKIDVSWARTYTDDGRVTRTWAPVHFGDSVAAVLSAPAGTDPAKVRLRAPADGLEIGNAPLDAVNPDIDRRLQWSDGSGSPVWPVGIDPAKAWGGWPPAQDAVDTAFTEDLGDRVPNTGPEASRIGYSFWHAAGRTPDGSRLVAGEIALDADPTRVYALLRSPRGTLAAAARQVQPDSPLPVAVPLPRDQGWLVAAKGATLRYRVSADAGWQDAGQNAALLPAAAVSVEVHLGDRTDVVPLQR